MTVTFLSKFFRSAKPARRLCRLNDTSPGDALRLLRPAMACEWLPGADPGQSWALANSGKAHMVVGQSGPDAVLTTTIIRASVYFFTRQHRRKSKTFLSGGFQGVHLLIFQTFAKL